jgi:hypothetical protein
MFQQLNKANVNNKIRMVYMYTMCCVDGQISKYLNTFKKFESHDSELRAYRICSADFKNDYSFLILNFKNCNGGTAKI